MNDKVSDNHINEISESITERLIQIRMFDVSEIRAIINSHVRMALTSLIRNQIIGIEKDILDKKSEIANCANTKQLPKLQAQLSELNFKRKQLHQTQTYLEYRDKYYLIHKFVRENVSEEKIKEFNQMINEKFPRPEHLVNI